MSRDYNHPMTDNSADPRLERLTQWTRQILNRSDLHIEVASADASFRRYFRAIAGDATWIIMDAPPDKEDVAPTFASVQCSSGLV